MIKIKGLAEIYFSGRDFKKSIEFDLRAVMKRTIIGSKQTTLYNNITGLLRRSSIIRRIGKRGSDIVGTLLNRAPYSGFIHEGTARITPRPFLMQSLEPELEGLRNRLGDSTVKALIHKRIR